MQNVLVGLIVASLLAFTLAVPSIAGISTWKFLLAALGFLVFARAGRRS